MFLTVYFQNIHLTDKYDIQGDITTIEIASIHEKRPT